MFDRYKDKQIQELQTQIRLLQKDLEVKDAEIARHIARATKNAEDCDWLRGINERLQAQFVEIFRFEKARAAFEDGVKTANTKITK